MIKIGFIGLGNRGIWLLKTAVVERENVSVVSVCDAYEDRAQDGAKAVLEATGKEPVWETDYRKVIDNPDVEAVIIATSWETHIEIAIYAMKAGKAVALEVGGTNKLEECWDLVDTYEATKTPFMLMENCCYGRREMMALNMVKQGLFGDIVHCAGGYHHDLRKEVSFGVENRHYRLEKYKNHNAENYPTHELGPIAKVLDINHGNRLVSLISVASQSAGLHEYIVSNKSDDEELKNTTFKQGDIVTTVINCENGQTITMTLDTTLPRFYSRGFTVRGTKGMYEEATDSVFLDCEEDIKHELSWRKDRSGNAGEYEEKYDHPVWKRYLEEGVKGDHDGMDWLEFSIFFDCLENGKPMPIDVYDAATWMAVTALSEESIANGSVKVEFPDFTRGKWRER